LRRLASCNFRFLSFSSQDKSNIEEGLKDRKLNSDTNQQVSFKNAKPTLTHKAITKLAAIDKVKFCVTQNVDGLHMRSGLARSKHCFLHGCIFTEKCEVCKKEYFRDFDVGGLSFQKTGRICNKNNCGGALRDTLLDWNDPLPEDEWARAQGEFLMSDLAICLGTSLRIEPVGSLPTMAKSFVIVNLQVTPHDDKAKLIIRAFVDDVMEYLMEKLGIEGCSKSKS